MYYIFLSVLRIFSFNVADHLSPAQIGARKFWWRDLRKYVLITNVINLHPKFHSNVRSKTALQWRNQVAKQAAAGYGTKFKKNFLINTV